jgi:Ca-activated chloride channel family protein
MNNNRLYNSVFIVLANAAVLGLWLWVRNKFEFANPAWFWMLLVIPAISIWSFIRPHINSELKISSLSYLSDSTFSLLAFFRPGLFILRAVGFSLLVIALARPQSKTAWQDKTTEGIDIVISFDVSASMLAKDFEPNRLDAAKSIAIDFISQRPNDRIGLVVYEGEAFTQCPLTTDHKVLTNLFREVRSGLIDGGTAIGMGLATAVNRLKESEAKSRVVILLTDGVNNAGAIPPVTAAEIAREFGVRVYAIGVGTQGRALSPVAIYPNGQYKYDYVEVQIDEEALTQVAQMTNGKYFRATDNNSLKSIYQEIDTLEKTRIQVTQHSKRHEEFFIFALFGLSLIAFEFFLKNTVFRTVT